MTETHTYQTDPTHCPLCGAECDSAEVVTEGFPPERLDCPECGLITVECFTVSP